MDRIIEFSTNHWYYTVALGVTLALIAHSFIAPHLRRFKAISPAEATAMINHQDALVLDVRESHEFNKGHIIDSLHIPLAKLDERRHELEPHKARPIVVVCQSGSRTTAACNNLVKNGFEKVFTLRGGILEWQNANLPLVTGNKPKKRRKGGGKNG
ncbi:MAG: rhodanese-like domain-containing protein [Gammaproteobacteria bacterium]